MISVLLLASLAAIVTFVCLKDERSLCFASIIWSSLVGVVALMVAWPALVGDGVISTQLFNVDAFAALLIILVGFVQWTATLVSSSYLREELHEKIITFKQARLYHIMLQLFVLSMMLVLTADAIGVMWIALEATTLATTMLVAFYTREGSLEAAWKYIVLCSVGISLGLLGVLLVSYAAMQAGLGVESDALSFTVLRDSARFFPPSIIRWAFVFIFIGYGTKVGLVPMHTWLPDAHGRTPSPISGMLSGVLLSVALFAILRFKSLTDIALGSSTWTNQLFLIFGAASFILPAAFMIVQKNYKRLLAYSSIEHMGFMVFCIGLGAPGMLAAVVHLIGHALIKSMLFFGTGNMLLRWKSTKFENVGPLTTALPYTGGLFVFGVMALLAIPPSPLFLSEYLGFTAAFATHPWLAFAMLLGGTVIFAGMIKNVMPMVYGKREDSVKAPPERFNLSHVAMCLHLVLVVSLGVFFLTANGQAHLTRIVTSVL